MLKGFLKAQFIYNNNKEVTYTDLINRRFPPTKNMRLM